MSTESSTPVPTPPSQSTSGSVSSTPGTQPKGKSETVTNGGKKSHDVGSNVFENIAGIAWGVLVAVFFFGSILKAAFGIGEPRLDIVVAAQPSLESNGWSLSGRVLFKGIPIPATNLWAIISDDRGNRLSPTAVTNDGLGAFLISGIPAILSGTNKPKSLEANVYARTTIVTDSKKGEPQSIEGHETLALGARGGIRWVKLPLWAIVPLLTVFLGSIVLALLPFGHGSWGIRAKYFGSVSLALILTVAMVVYLSIGLLRINLTGTKGEVVSLGFANIFHGTYSKDVEPEWLLSLTSPTPASVSSVPGTPDVAHGFGAPLWVLFLAVIGSGIFTLLIVIRGINDPVNFDSDGDVAKRVEEIVRHQFYIIFSPVGAVFVYQLMVVGGMTTQPVTVALVALAAGVSLNLLLDKALALVLALFQDAEAKRNQREAKRKVDAETAK